MFKKILIANRGEIACRIIATARRMGIATVAVFSEADNDALHVQMADEAVAIGPAPAAQSYLSIANIVAACRKTKAAAVHPGYGFLSENQEFAAALEAAGIVFIGPPAAAVAAMGDKIESKKLARAAGVSTIPGHAGAVPTPDAAVKIAREIGYPVMIKASAGGGGKGMRIARNDREIGDGFRSATAEAKNAFGDDRLLIEKFIEDPRHIEIQVLGDAHGNTLHLGERECSIQRRHQKVIEEAPSPFLDAPTRAAMGAQAVALAKAVGYRSAGTVEFVVDRRRNFFFLEMNTRLQVEHPVTEMVTKLDLVEQMIRIAAGEKLALRQEDIRLSGSAIEARIYAEDPRRDFLPSIGRLVRYRPPPPEPHVRVDTGVYEGAEIGIHYDPMIAKLIVHAPDRATAAAHLAEALDRFVIGGLNHNTAFLSAIVRTARFREANLSTSFIADEFPGGFKGAPITEQALARFIAVAACAHAALRRREVSLTGRWRGFRLQPERDWHIRVGGEGIDVAIEGEPEQADVLFRRNGKERRCRVAFDWQIGQPLLHAEIDGQRVTMQIERRGLGWQLIHAGAAVEATVLTRRAAELQRQMPEKIAPDTSRLVLSPMPGLLVSIAVKPGQQVRAGEELAVVEAMKMQNILRAQRDGVVKLVHATPGASLAVDQAIVEFA